MGLQIVRFEKDSRQHWGVVHGNDIIVLQETFGSLAQFLQKGKEKARQLYEQGDGETVSLQDATILSPVTAPAKIICQGANYASHREESGFEAKRPPFNLIFSKADSCLCGAYADIIRPPHVKLLDYEIELGLVIGADITEPVEVTEENLHEYVAGLVMFNDVSARDVQLLQGQWLKGKSYRTFGPTGPYLYLLDPEEIPLIHDLELKLWVNDELRQSANTSQLLFKPHETLTELSGIMDLSIGDLVVTGTTGGVALNLSPEEMGFVSNLTISYEERAKKLFESQLKIDDYLKDGDIIRARIKSPDGRIDLGEQINKIVSARI